MKPAQKQEARALRAGGCSVRDIARRLQVSRGTVSLWVRDIELTPEQMARLDDSRRRGGYAGVCKGASVNKANAERRHALFRQAGYERARTDEQFRLVCALYWGEGTKKSKGTFAVVNSDPNLLRFVLRWLLSSGYADAIRFRVRYHPGNGLSEAEIREWWLSQLPGLTETHLTTFSPCLVHRASQHKHVGRLPYGTAELSVSRAELFYNIQDGIAYLIETGA